MKRQFETSVRQWRALLFVVGMWGVGCTGSPSADQLEEWRQEALDANQQAVSAASETLQDGDTSQDHELRILGGSESTQPTQLGWAELQALPQTEVHTISPHQTGIKGTVYHYRGVAVSELLKHHGVAKTAQQVTFVAYDGFRSTVSVKDLMNYPILIATERNGRPIPRGEGGPILLVFPYSEHPELASRYPDRWWVFYVNHLVVDTPSFELDVMGTRIDQGVFESLPGGQLWVTGRYKVNWPASQVLVKGVFLRDLLHHANVELAPGEHVSLAGIAPIHRDAARPVLISREQIEKCDVLVANRKGEDAEVISAEYGGPLVMAYPPECARELDDRAWMVHLQAITRAK